MSKPLAVLISDVHYRLDTLPLADNAMRQAIGEAALVGAPLVVAGDLNDTKATLRGEVVNAIIKTMAYAREVGVSVFIIVGNHDRIHEKNQEHSLNFLRPYAVVVDKPTRIQYTPILMIPYQSDADDFRRIIKDYAERGDIIIMHQGVNGGDMGAYVQDHSAIETADVDKYRCVSGHYHNAHTVGTVSYIGNPYTLTYGEVNDPEKGFQILYEGGSLEHVPTRLRKHVVVELNAKDMSYHKEPPKSPPVSGDLVWVKLHGTALELDGIDKDDLGFHNLGYAEYKLDKIVNDSEQPKAEKFKSKKDGEILDQLIDNSDESENDKRALKDLWRQVLS